MIRYFLAVAVFGMMALFSLATMVAAAEVDQNNIALPSGDEGMSKPHDNDQGRRANRRLTFIDVFFLTREHGFAVGSGGILFSTIDGGKNWNRRKISDEDLRQIYFQDSTRGWILMDTAILRTEDAGKTWTLAAPPDPRAVRRIYFVNAQVGWLLGSTGLIFKTTDGGKIWRRQSSGVKETLRKIACFNVSSCIVAGERNTVLNTSNGGQTWLRRSPKIAAYFNINSVQTTRSGTAWALAVTYKTGYLLQSSNQGRTWGIARRLLDDNPRSIHFFDGQRGVLLDAIAIMYTEDGGSTWKDGWPGGPVLNAFFFLDDKLAWAVGDFETILHTEDGGKTWVKQHDDGVIPIPHDR